MSGRDKVLKTISLDFEDNRLFSHQNEIDKIRKKISNKIQVLKMR
jgi:hypothetical protein